jgi:threonine aldolase
MAGGRVYPQAVIDEICDEAHALGVKVHVDGARIFNAAEASGTPVRRIVERVDTVQFCLSKALGAPAGSMVAGPKALIDKGRLYRKRLGGGMRQVGVLAAAGLIAMECHPAKLAADHANARLLAEALAKVPGIAIDAADVQSNIVIFDVSATGVKPSDISARLKAAGVLMNAINDRQMRAVTHFDVTREQCLSAVETLRTVCSK